MRDGFLRLGGVSILQCCFASVLAGFKKDRCGKHSVRIAYIVKDVGCGGGQGLTFSKEREVEFYDLAVETEHGAQVGLDDIASDVSDADNLGGWLFGGCAILHVDVGITGSAWRG